MAEARESKKRKRAKAPASESASHSESAARFLTEHGISISMRQQEPPRPCVTLEDAPFPPSVVALLHAKGITAPSAVQGATWPYAVEGHDVLAIAQTGSGKTLAFLLPALSVAVRYERSTDSPRCLVVVPTRELAIQVHTEALKFGATLGCRTLAVYGGASKHEQAQKLKLGTDVLVATPGRLMDHLGTHHSHQAQDGLSALRLSYCLMLVLDEAEYPGRIRDPRSQEQIRGKSALPAEGSEQTT